jgi:large subunit ribosomal protein L28
MPPRKADWQNFLANLGADPVRLSFGKERKFVKAPESSMSRKCQLTGKKANNAYSVSHSHRRTKRLQHVNLQDKRVWWAEGNRWVRLRLSTKALKTIEKNGLGAMAKKAGLDLNKF